MLTPFALSSLSGLCLSNDSEIKLEGRILA